MTLRSLSTGKPLVCQTCGGTWHGGDVRRLKHTRAERYAKSLMACEGAFWDIWQHLDICFSRWNGFMNPGHKPHFRRFVSLVSQINHGELAEPWYCSSLSKEPVRAFVVKKAPGPKSADWHYSFIQRAEEIGERLVAALLGVAPSKARRITKSTIPTLKQMVYRADPHTADVLTAFVYWRAIVWELLNRPSNITRSWWCWVDATSQDALCLAIYYRLLEGDALRHLDRNFSNESLAESPSWMDAPISARFSRLDADMYIFRSGLVPAIDKIDVYSPSAGLSLAEIDKLYKVWAVRLIHKGARSDSGETEQVEWIGRAANAS
jgi:hypothetical protein